MRIDHHICKEDIRLTIGLKISIVLFVHVASSPDHLWVDRFKGGVFVREICLNHSIVVLIFVLLLKIFKVMLVDVLIVGDPEDAVKGFEWTKIIPGVIVCWLRDSKFWVNSIVVLKPRGENSL